jgi:hypothetical protein
VRLAAALALVSLAGCSSAPSGPIEVAALLAQCDALKGKQVQLAGYLAGCEVYGCALYADERQSRESEISLRTHAAPPTSVGIAPDTAFDRKAAAFQGQYVVIAGRVDSKDCTGEGGTDRSFGLAPTDIRAWTTSEGAPAKLIE